MLGLGLVVVNLVMGVGRIADGSPVGGALTIAAAVFWAFYAWFFTAPRTTADSWGIRVREPFDRGRSVELPWSEVADLRGSVPARYGGQVVVTTVDARTVRLDMVPASDLDVLHEIRQS